MIKSIVNVPAGTIVDIVFSLGITGLIAMVVSVMSERSNVEDFCIHLFYSILMWAMAGIVYFGYAMLKTYF